MPSYKFKYFDARGLGEVSRLLFALSGTAYEDIRFKPDTWPAEKPNTPLGQLPVLEVTDKGEVVKICQSFAIARYLARTFSLYGSSDVEAARVDEVIGVVMDTFQQMVKARFEKDTTRQAELMKTLKDEQLPKHSKMLDTLLKVTKGTFILGDKISLADLALFDLVQKMEQTGFEAIDKSVKDCKEAVAADPKIAAWLKKRPVTEN